MTKPCEHNRQHSLIVLCHLDAARCWGLEHALYTSAHHHPLAHRVDSCQNPSWTMFSLRVGPKWAWQGAHYCCHCWYVCVCGWGTSFHLNVSIIDNDWHSPPLHMYVMLTAPPPPLLFISHHMFAADSGSNKNPQVFRRPEKKLSTSVTFSHRIAALWNETTERRRRGGW